MRTDQLSKVIVRIRFYDKYCRTSPAGKEITKRVPGWVDLVQLDQSENDDKLSMMGIVLSFTDAVEIAKQILAAEPKESS